MSNTRKIDETTGFPVVDEGMYWRVREIDRYGQYGSEYSEKDALEDVHGSRLPADAVIVELRRHSSGKASVGRYFDYRYDPTVKFQDGDPYLYRMVQRGTKAVTKGIPKGFWGRKYETIVVQEPIWVKEYIIEERDSWVGQTYSPSSKRPALILAALEVLDGRDAQLERDKVLGDYPPKTLNGEN